MKIQKDNKLQSLLEMCPEIMSTVLTKPSKHDFHADHGFFHKKVIRLKREIFLRQFHNSNEIFWRQHTPLNFDETHRRISSAIFEKMPFAIGRLGGVEANILQWAKQIPKGIAGFFARPFYSETLQGSTNAGIRPRNKESYRLFAEIALSALGKLDLQGVWKGVFESIYLPMLPQRDFYEVEIVAPSNGRHIHWMEALDNKTVLVVTPFAKSVAKQIPKLADVWRPRGWKPKINFHVVPFPYLIDEGYEEAWWEVYLRIGRILEVGEYDVAIFGCGGLGLPFAAISKSAGRVGLHLGGHCQLLFGIYGRRHYEQEWFKNSFTPAWIQPERTEVPKSANRVEGGCYW